MISDRRTASINEATQKSFPQGYKRKYKLFYKITSNNTTGNKDKSAILISTWCYRNKLFPVTVDMLKRDLAIVIFKELSIANKCLELCKNESNGFLNFFINRRMNSCRGVIINWPLDIPELWENIVNKDEIIKIERMKRKM